MCFMYSLVYCVLLTSWRFFVRRMCSVCSGWGKGICVALQYMQRVCAVYVQCVRYVLHMGSV